MYITVFKLNFKCFLFVFCVIELHSLKCNGHNIYFPNYNQGASYLVYKTLYLEQFYLPDYDD